VISEEVMRQVRRLQIYTGRAVNEVFAGEYESTFKGRGMEFAEVREYQPGDDVRTMDWNVTARAGHPFVKQFVEERELTVVLAVDLSSSGRFGSVKQLKNQLAAEFCAVLAFTATRNNDKVGLLIFTDRLELYIPPKKGSRHVLRVIRELLSFEPKAARTDVAGALDYLAKVLNKRAVIFLVSDFIASGYERSLNLLNRRHDVIAASVGDPRERALPDVGLIELEDAETGQSVLVDTGSARVRDAYGAWACRGEAQLDNELRRIGVDRIAISTGTPYVQSLIGFFRTREKRR
jgi:uncharacterized protein (DUF58 family)